ncbi:MAG TPA: rhomboid family intramembrane serine protease [Bacteroidetes bacterium]|nr:rhomboid family intramembrane serine protease [Bacteroidota bacterium]
MSYYHRTYQIGLGGRLTPGVKYLLVANVIVYILQLVFRAPMLRLFGLSSFMVLHNLAIWQFVSYMFLHGGFFHIFFNMFVLWIFGSEVERAWGTKPFLKYYFITGIGAGICSFLFSLSMHTITIGASGAIYGVMLAFAMMYPDRIITLLLFLIIPISMKAKHLVTLMAVISIFSGITNLFGGSDGVAHFAHLGGMLVGYLYLKSDWRLAAAREYLRRKLKMWQLKSEIHRIEHFQNLQRQVDQILDKINEVGYENLTEKEKKILEEASNFFTREGGKE